MSTTRKSKGKPAPPPRPEKGSSATPERRAQLRKRGTSVKGGRPPRTAPPLPWDDIDRLLVYGELVAGQHTPVYPNFTELGKRFGCAPSTVSEYAKKQRCLIRRQEAAARQRVVTEEKLITMRAEAIVRSAEDEVRTIDKWLHNFEDAVESGKATCNNPLDYDRLVRLKEFVLGGPDQRKEVNATLTLEALQARHAAAMRVQQASVEERGEAPALPPRSATSRPMARQRHEADVEVLSDGE